MKYHCCDLRRLEVLRAPARANAIEFLEVLDRAEPPGAPRQRTLFVRLLRPRLRRSALRATTCASTAASASAASAIEWVRAGRRAAAGRPSRRWSTGIDEPARTLVVRTDSAGDFSRYTLRIVAELRQRRRRRPASTRCCRASTSRSRSSARRDFDCAAAAPARRARRRARHRLPGQGLPAASAA